MNRVNIWVADWEMQCCGDPFKKGETVEWRVSEYDRSYLLHIDGADVTDIDYYYDNHDMGGKLYEIRGIVTKIQAVYALYEPRYDDKWKRDILTPVAYKAMDYKAVDFDSVADGWEKDIDEYKFLAYLAELDCEKL